MKRTRVDYNQLAPVYHSRYDGAGKLDGIAQALRNFKAGKVLEAGCGTGRFVQSLRESGAKVFGVDASTGMLAQAAARLGTKGLVVGRANDLPFAPATFDLVCCVNAIHHFDDPHAFVLDAAPLLQPGGVLAIVGIDPRTIRHRYFYEYFEGALELDMVRYPSCGQIVDWAAEAQLENVELNIVEKPVVRYSGKEVFGDTFLAKRSNSLLTLLSEEVYAEGLRQIEAAASHDKVFISELPFGMVTGRRPANASSTERM
jgi:SAM-dependent methyltransferase